MWHGDGCVEAFFPSIALEKSVGGHVLSVCHMSVCGCVQVAVGVLHCAMHTQHTPQVTTDWVSLIDEWSARFFDEMDYRLEAANAMNFKAQIEPLCEGIVVPDVVEGLSNESVLVTVCLTGRVV